MEDGGRGAWEQRHPIEQLVGVYLIHPGPQQIDYKVVAPFFLHYFISSAKGSASIIHRLTNLATRKCLVCVVLYCIALHCIALCWVVLYCTVLYCTVL